MARSGERIINIGPSPGCAPNTLSSWGALNSSGPQFPTVKDVSVGFACSLLTSWGMMDTSEIIMTG